MIGRAKVGKVVIVAEVFYLRNPLSSKTCANTIDASVIKRFSFEFTPHRLN